MRQIKKAQRHTGFTLGPVFRSRKQPVPYLKIQKGFS